MRNSVLLFALPFFPLSAEAINDVIPAGTTQTGGEVPTITKQYVYGTADNYTVYGKQYLQSGGVSHNSIIYGQQTVEVGGTSYNTNVIYDGIQDISGKSYSSKVDDNGNINVNNGGSAYQTNVSGGALNVNNGGSAYQTNVSGGTLTVYKGGNAVDTVITSGTETVYGTDKNANIQGGTQLVQRYGKVYDAQINGGTQQINVSGEAYNTIINSGTQNVYGDSYSSIINTNGVMNIYSSGYAENTIISGGQMIVKSGGFSSETLLESGSQLVYGQDLNGTITGGTQTILDGGVADETNIKGGLQIIGKDSYAYNNIISDSGIQQIDSGGFSYRSQVSSGGKINVAGEAHETKINTDGSLTVVAGGLAQDTSINGGSMTVEANGSAANTTLSSGSMTVAGKALETKIDTDGTLTVAAGGLAQDTSINGGSMTVEANGSSANTTLSSGSMIVAGKALETKIDTDGTLTVAAGGLAQDTSINGGSMTVEANGSSAKTTLSSGSMTVAGTDTNSQILGGIQTVQSGGSVSNASVSSSGIQYVLVGGKIINSQVSSGGKINVDGEAYSTVVYTGGLATFNNGSLANNTLIKGGKINILSGAVANDTVINSGFEYVAGTSNHSTVNYLGSQIIQNGGVSQNAVINASGTQNILAGGSSLNSVINPLGTQNVFQNALSTNANIFITGKQNIYAGGKAQDTTLYGGTQIVYGEALNTTINSGLQEIKKGGTAYDTQITYGGIQTVLDGGMAENSQFDNGTLRLFSGGRLLGMTSATDSILYISGNNSIPSLTSDNSLINIAYTPSFTSLIIDNLNGTGVFTMSSNLAAGISDQITIHDGDGNFGLIVNDYSANEAPDKFKIIDEDSAAHDSFYLIGGAVDVGAFRYDLVQEGDDWYLEHTDQISDATYVARNTFTALSSLFFSHLSPVYNRLHFQHQNSQHLNGLWIKGIGRRVNLSYQDGTNSHSDIYGESLGFDHQIYTSDAYQIISGIFSGYTSSKQHFDVLGRGDGQTYSFGLYSTLLTENKWFFDVMGTYFTHSQKNQSATPAGTPVLAKFDTDGWQTALSLGKRIDFQNNWFLSPYVGLNYMYINGVDYQTNFNTYIQADNTDYFSNTLGITGGKTFLLDNKVSLDAYSQANIIYDWDAKNSIVVADYPMTEDMASLHYEFTLGLNASWNDHNSAYMEFTSQFGSHVDIPWEFSLGYQYDF